MIHLLHGREIDRYFAGARDAETIRAAFARVWRCATCRRHYERELLFERARPDAPTSDTSDARLWKSIQATARAGEATAGVGQVAVSAPHGARFTPARAAFLVVAVAGALLAVGPLRGPLRGTHRLSPSGDVAEPVARGGEPGLAAAPTLHVYRNVGGHAEPVLGAVHGGDGLLIAYSNPTDLRFLMVFAVDGAAGVHWYYPAYERLGDNPLAVPVQPRALGVELGEEIRHKLPVGRMKMVALFLPAPRDVLDVERAIAATLARSGGDLEALRGLAEPGGVELALPLEVQP